MFIPRHLVIDNQFCQFAAQTTVSGGAGNVLAYAGSACYLDDTALQFDASVKLYVANENKPCFGFLMQKIKTGYHSIHPAGFMMPGDLGSSDAIAQPSYDANGRINGTKAVPVGVAHLGIWDTIHYAGDGTNGMVAGKALYVRQSSLSELCDTSLTENTQPGIIAYVVKGASGAQVTANMANTALYPIRVKLLC